MVDFSGGLYSINNHDRGGSFRGFDYRLQVHEMPDDKLFEILKIRCHPGALILNHEGRLLYSNRKALEILPLLRTGETEQAPDLQEIVKMCQTSEEDVDVSCAGGAGDMRFKIFSDAQGCSHAVRAFRLGDSKDGSEATHILALIERVVDHRTIDIDAARKAFKLTKREGELVDLVYRGLNNREIAEKKFISEHTVKVHLKNIMKKMKAGSRQEICALLT